MDQATLLNIVGYEIFIKSFASSKKSVGDLLGIEAKLAYLNELGVNLIWITPFNKSPQIDSGYDVSDYYKIDEQYGTMDDLSTLIKTAHNLNIKVIMDLVLNHTSNQHEWFIDSCAQINGKEDFYIWRNEPNNWLSFLNESAWTYVEKRRAYYLHIFTENQPDLNFDNPKVRQAMLEVAKFYLEMGIDGFRLDAIAHLAKDRTFEDSKLTQKQGCIDTSKFSNRKDIIIYLRELRHLTNQYKALLIGEVGGDVSMERAKEYLNTMQGVMDLAFTFNHSWLNNMYGKLVLNKSMDNTLINTKLFIENYQLFYQGYGNDAVHTINWLNHDQPRLITHYGNAKKVESAKMLATLLYLLYGAIFIYYGEEVGMENEYLDSIAKYSDIEAINFYKNAEYSNNEKLYHLYRMCRDSARGKMDWQAINNDINIHYKALLAFRKKHPALINERNVEFIDCVDNVICFKRTSEKQELLVLVNVSNVLIEASIDYLHNFSVKDVVFGVFPLVNNRNYQIASNHYLVCLKEK